MRGKKRHEDKIRWLSSYRERVSAVRDYEEKIAELRAAGLSSKPLTGMPRSGGKKDVSDRYCRIMTLEEKYQELRQKAFDESVEIMEAIEGLGDSRHRMVLRKRFISNKTLERIADEMRITKEHTCRLQGEALERIKIPEQMNKNS